MKTVKVEIPAEVGAELIKQYGFEPFTRTCQIVFEREAIKHYSNRGASQLLVGVTGFDHFYFVIEEGE